LPDDIRSGLEEIVAEVTEWGNARAEAINQEAKAQILASGRGEIIELTDEELVAWQEGMRPVWDEFSDDIGQELIDAALASRPGNSH
jgi:C4-dicarboxylate-binding protein DctP